MARKLASIQRIAEVKPLPETDKICAYRIKGWWVVDQVNKYQVGNYVVYIEADAWVPTTLAPFLSKGKEPKEYMGIPGELLRTIKFKKQVSQGLILPISSCISSSGCWYSLEEGLDVSEWLNITKWEPPAEFSHADAKGLRPFFIPKTDQERIQNCYHDVSSLFQEVTFEVTEKLEGQPFSAYFTDGVFGVCSRNLELKDSESNTFWNTARQYKLEEKLKTLGRNICIQGEQCGPGISGNIYKMNDYHLYIFDVYDIDKGEYLLPKERREFVRSLGLESVPILSMFTYLTPDITCDNLLKYADGTSVLGYTDTLREGLVYKANEMRLTFKTVSNKYLLNEK